MTRESGRMYEELVQTYCKVHQGTCMRRSCKYRTSQSVHPLQDTFKPSTLRLLFGSILLCWPPIQHAFT